MLESDLPHIECLVASKSTASAIQHYPWHSPSFVFSFFASHDQSSQSLGVLEALRNRWHSADYCEACSELERTGVVASGIWDRLPGSHRSSKARTYMVGLLIQNRVICKSQASQGPGRSQNVHK